MEFLDSLKSKFQKYHKKNNITEHRQTRVEETRLTRLNLRSRTMDQGRNLDKMTPIAPRIKSPRKATPRLDRKAKMLIWKQEKEKARAREKKVQKPIFKLGGAPNVGFPELQSFAPKDHKFKPPKNIKTFPLNTQQTKRVTRSQKPVASPPLELPRRTRAPKQPEREVLKPQPRHKNKLVRQNAILTRSDKLEALEVDKENTPVKNPNTSENIYVSPFVTTSRGKGSVKKENLDRSLRGLLSFSDRKSTSSGVNYFNNVLQQEIDRLEELCREWNEYKLENNETINEDAIDLIDVAIGQATLLINKKFQQFKGLIEACKTGQGAEKPVTCEDLQGFWDMIYMQVENCCNRFNRLTMLKTNNWVEAQPEVPVKVVKKQKTVKTTKPAASSGIRAAILAARKKKQESSTGEENSVFDGGFFVVRTPQKNKTNNRTPKSILKSNKKSTAILNKSVLFKDEEDENQSELNTTFEVSPRKKEKSRRKSSK